ncbi:hypothetical protein M2480_001218 [Parabacteroides sp. PFB2-12]|uniref:FimB/Mfa2 family fimbrial subunit n=1 Tax=unclassified Parabacteroides TaxID=2649774 RepID=UPI002476B5D9|nr:MULTISPECIES: FimB/Mfa2 family fimbrial subunit [unclassified Parabacteroides]MDH6344199.1 hypothetical protein [Parabacteroides sp. PM6-13]MDH6390245.1 hypothetical protein [Parabacteroides sp. PFB2-12]
MRTNIFNKGLLAIATLSTLLAFTSCSSDSDSNYTATEVVAPKQADFTVRIKAIDKAGKDITTYGEGNDVTLYIFDDNYDFIASQNIAKAAVMNGQKIQIHAQNANRITVVAWAGLSNNKEEVSSLTKANILSDLRVQLKQNNGQVTTPPSDLFYGQLTLDRAQTKADQVNTLVVARKVAQFTLATLNVTETYGTTGDYYYKITSTSDAIDYNGKVTGSVVSYIVPTSVNEMGNLTKEQISIFPSENVTVELYRNDQMILSSKNFQKTENIAVNEGEQAVVYFNAANSNKITYQVANFGTVVNIVNVA